MKTFSSLVLLIGLNPLVNFSVPSASAEVVQCNGVWVNHPCEGTVQGTLNEQKVVETPEDVARREKRSMLHEITMKSIRAREEFDVKMDVKEVGNYCQRTTTSVDDCRKRISEFEKELDRKSESEAKFADERRKRREDEEKQKIERTKAESNATAVTIVQGNGFRNPRGGYYPNPRPNPGNPYPGNQYPGNQYPGNSGSSNSQKYEPGYTDSKGYYLPKPDARINMGGQASPDGRYQPEWK